MTWRSSTTVPERIFASLVYLLPLFDGLSYGGFLFRQFHLEPVFLGLLRFYGSLPLQPYTGLIIFFVLLFGVVRNEEIGHFVRFNTMQAILLDLILLLSGLILGILTKGIQLSFVVETLYNMVFLGIVAAVVYSVVQSLMGRYAEIPTISDAVHMQVR